MPKSTSEGKLSGTDSAVASCGTDVVEPFPRWMKPTEADVSAMLDSSFFQNDVLEARQAHARGDGLLPRHVRGASSCDLVAGVVLLLLSAPFSPYGFCAEMFVRLLGALYVATTLEKHRSDPPPPVQWDAVAALDDARVRSAVRDGVSDDFFYEPSTRATRAWCRSRASRICALLRCLRDRHGAISLQWLKSMPTHDAIRSLTRLPGVSLHCAAALLLFELHIPLLPVCTNCLEEAKAIGWVPPSSGAHPSRPARLSLRIACSGAKDNRPPCSRVLRCSAATRPLAR